jgi:hypothetical protein
VVWLSVEVYIYPLDRRDMATIVAINSSDATTPQKNLLLLIIPTAPQDPWNSAKKISFPVVAHVFVTGLAPDIGSRQLLISVRSSMPTTPGFKGTQPALLAGGSY